MRQSAKPPRQPLNRSSLLRLAGWLSILLLLAACNQQASGPRQVDPDSGPTPIPTRQEAVQPTYTVERGEVLFQLDFPARVGPTVESVLAFPRDGQVTAVHVDRGALVEAGAVLADLDTTSLEADRLQLEAELALAQDRLAAVQEQMARDRERAEINVALARLDLDYARAQADEPPTPEQQYEIDRRALELQLAQLALNEVADTADPLLQADIDEAQLRLAEVEELLAQNALVAPFDGQLISFNVSEGQRVQAQNRVGIIADTTLLELHATLLESELQELAEGMAATMTASDRPGAQFTGFIRRLPFPFGSLGENLEILEGDNSARIAFDDPAAANSFELGDRLRVNVLVERRENALWLPPAALRNFSGRDFVIVQDGAGQRRIDVVLGVEGEGRVEIVSGLEEGAVVVGP